MIVLSGDVGGTSTRLQFTEFNEDGKVSVLKNSHFNNSDYVSFSDVVSDFLSETDFKIDVACFGVAGPVINETVEFTNLSWNINATDIRRDLKLDKVHFLNDFVAIGYGLEALQKKDLVTLQAGKPKENAVKAYAGAGTGFGVGFMTYSEESYKVHPTEGGHVDFAPCDDVQQELLTFLREKYRRVSVERLLSGQGLIDIYSFVRLQESSGEKENSDLDRLIGNDQGDIDLAAAIVEYATKHSDLLAKRALDIFIDIYGAAIGNLALTTLPFGGLYIVGGIAPKLLREIKEGQFLEAFSNKGRMKKLIQGVPLYVVLCTEVGLKGAALYAKKFLV